MIYLDDKADTCPNGLQGTPFWEAYRALRQVAVAGAWPVDPGAYRAGMAWGWYALHKPEYLTNFRNVVQAALISACAPMIKPTQADAELVEYLRQWREYRPTFPQLQSLYSLFGAVVDVRSTSDPESQAVLPVDDTRLAFYLRVESVDPERPLSLSDAITIAVRATPIGSRPYAYYVQESRVTVPVALAPSGVTVWVENDTVASDPPTPPAPALPTVSNTMYLFNSSGGLGIGQINTLIDSNNNTVDYDTTACYACQNCMDSSGVAKNPTSLAIVNESGILKVTNISDNHISVYYVWTKKCSSNLATVITVYDSSNNPYNAFQYTSDGTDYYYVLDGTQTDWTDDLASIGYGLVNVYKSWVSASKSQETVSTSLNQYLYSNSGKFIAADDSKTYTIISVDGNTSSDILSKLAIFNTHVATPERLGIKARNNTYWEIQMTYVEYTIS